MKIGGAGAALLLAALALAGCGGGFGGPKREQPEVVVDPNAYPVNYRKQVVSILLASLTDRADYQGALIAAPQLKPIGQSQHYVVCLQLNGHNQRKDKMVVFLEGVPTQFIDAKPEFCADAAYQPYGELQDMMPTAR